MNYTDLHCDTISRCFKEKKSFYDGELQINAVKAKNIEKYRQCFALWLGDELRGETAFSLCKNILGYYEKEVKPVIDTNTGISAYLTIENASALGGNLSNISYFGSRGIKIMSLTWNGENDLASGVKVKGGLKALGKEAIREMENCSIIVDVSHLNERSFRELCKVARKPFIATHSNCYDICPHKRNLKRWQVKEIIDRGGIIGLNFYPAFLGKGKFSVFERIGDNIRYLLSLGGEDSIALGSDFDGAEMSEELSGIDKVKALYEYLLSEGLSKRVVEGIFYKNSDRILNCRTNVLDKGENII